MCPCPRQSHLLGLHLSWQTVSTWCQTAEAGHTELTIAVFAVSLAGTIQHAGRLTDPRKVNGCDLGAGSTDLVSLSDILATGPRFNGSDTRAEYPAVQPSADAARSIWSWAPNSHECGLHHVTLYHLGPASRPVRLMLTCSIGICMRVLLRACMSRSKASLARGG